MTDEEREVRAVVETYTDPQAAWEALASRGVVPGELVETPDFSPCAHPPRPSHGLSDVCCVECMLEREPPRKFIARGGMLSAWYPFDMEDVAYYAPRARSLLVAEALAQEAIDRLCPFLDRPITPRTFRCDSGRFYHPTRGVLSVSWARPRGVPAGLGMEVGMPSAVANLRSVMPRAGDPFANDVGTYERLAESYGSMATGGGRYARRDKAGTFARFDAHLNPFEPLAELRRLGFCLNFWTYGSDMVRLFAMPDNG